ncbi:uncharacterized protein LOC103928117 isoform X8 [Pyrus x bretschneideri]|uniref:uncharacterized protein LOC103928117 isoform X8 n=1 Tax=Pyrus x bretschneideri TaxID=225117 RepID=UPI00202DCD42|nr:uncharacterized protein LOC103928117 isoform X8 [Pyrus x bretschneideri]
MWISSMRISDERIWTAMGGLVAMKQSLSSRAQVSPNRSLRRCDNRLTEITERASADKYEAESLAKKYEEKYKQAGDVASKLTIEEATFRDLPVAYTTYKLQEKKMELNRAVVKMEQEGDSDAHFRLATWHPRRSC